MRTKPEDFELEAIEHVRCLSKIVKNFKEKTSCKLKDIKQNINIKTI